MGATVAVLDSIGLPGPFAIAMPDISPALTALSPLDGRYAAKVAPLARHFSEYGLVRARVRVEIAWLVALSREPRIAEIAPFGAKYLSCDARTIRSRSPSFIAANGACGFSACRMPVRTEGAGMGDCGKTESSDRVNQWRL